MICIEKHFPLYSEDIKISFLQQKTGLQDLDLDRSNRKIESFM